MTSTPPSPTVAPADGKLGVLCVGLGAVTTTLIAGVELAKRGDEVPVGSLTQMGTLRLGKRTDDNVPLIRDFVPLASLDQIVFGAWDPSLAFVMAGGLLVNVIGYRLAFSRPHPVLADKFSLPDRSAIDVPLIAGSALFGVGWGLVGFCPGGLIPVLALGRREPVIFLLGLLAGIWAARVVMNATARARIAPLGRRGSP